MCTRHGVRICKTYGIDTVQVISENPYSSRARYPRNGFKTADAISMKLGIDKTAMIRVRAGISYALTEVIGEATAACRPNNWRRSP